MRTAAREWNQLRKVTITRNYIRGEKGSVLIDMGGTRILCAVSIDDNVPSFLKDSGSGWLTAEYSMLPMSTPERNPRGRTGGRVYEIQRFIGRSLRAVTDLSLLGERTVHIDCDVIQADGGTRTASITGSYIALVDALRRFRDEGYFESERLPVEDYVAAVSVGVVDGYILLDLDYKEDSTAVVDMNVVMTGTGKLIEIQGTAEETPFTRNELDKMLDVASTGIQELINIQKEKLGELD